MLLGIKTSTAQMPTPSLRRDMSFSLKAPVPLAAAFPAREVGTSRGIHSGRSQNRWTGVQNSLSWFTCRAIRFNVHRAGTCGVQKLDCAHVLMRRGLHHVVSSFGGDGPGAEELFRTKDDKPDRHPNDLSWDSYLGEVMTSERVEEPPQYVPPPPISAEERVLPGHLYNDKAHVLCSMLCAAVEVRNPVTCFRGSDKCFEWLRALMQVQASIKLHEVYYENDMEDSDKRRIFTVWTVNFLELVRANISDPMENLSESVAKQMSRETMFEMEKSGLISRICSTWYVLQEDDGASFSKAKDSLYHLLQRTF